MGVGWCASECGQWFREKYPNKVVAAWSSSGVVNAIFDFVEFDEQIAESAGPECAEAMRAATRAIEDMWGNGAVVGCAPVQSASDRMQELFGSRQGISKPDFFYMVADSGAMAIQYSGKSKICGTLVPAHKAGDDLAVVFANFTKSFWGENVRCFGAAGCLTQSSSVQTASTTRSA